MSREILSNNDRIIQRVDLRTQGFDDDDIEKPIIGIIVDTSASDKVLEQLKVGIYESNGTPLVFNIPMLNAAFSIGNSRYDLPNREIIADLVESLVTTSGIDGVIFATNNSFTMAGMAIASVRLNIPTIFFNTGISNNCNSTTTPQVSLAYAQNRGSKINIDELKNIELKATYGDNTLAGNAFLCALEVLGLMLPKVSTILNDTNQLNVLARATAKLVVNLVNNDIRPKMILNKDSFNNAITFNTSIGASFDSILHLIALGLECGIKIDFNLISNISDKTPTLVKCFANNTPALVKDFDYSGGVMATLNELSKKGLICANASTISNCDISSLYSDFEIISDGIISDISNPLYSSGALGVLYGTIAEDGALYNRRNLGNKPLPTIGKARVFDTLESAMSATSLNRINNGDIIVVRFEGVKGSPGMRSIEPLQNLLMGMSLSTSVGIITDGRATNNYDGIVVNCICPEAIEGGKISIIKDGDKLTIDYIKSKVEIDIVAKELNTRIKKFDNKDITVNGYLLKYLNFANSPKFGATTKKLNKR